MSTDQTSSSEMTTSSEKKPAWPRKRRPPPKWRSWHTFSLLLLLITIGVVGVMLPPLVSFLITMLLLAIFITILGHAIVGLWLGLLIDERNKLSLARLQLSLWTIVVLSGFMSAVLWNVRDIHNPNPMISIPTDLWLVMGISVTSLVGSPLILSTKTAAPEDADLSAQAKKEKDRTKEELKRQGLAEDVVDFQGKVVVWEWPEDARLADLFQGDEIGNAAHLDLGKVQMFFFTLVLVFVYVAMMANKFALAPDGTSIPGLPELDQSMVVLLGISHAGYLTNKAVPHSVTG